LVYFGIFFPLWYIRPRKIWQPCFRDRSQAWPRPRLKCAAIKRPLFSVWQNNHDSSATRDRCHDFKKNCRKNWSFFAQTTASFCKNMIITLVFEKNANFFRRKLAKIAENCDHNIDPRWACEKIAQTVSRTSIVSKLMRTFHRSSPTRRRMLLRSNRPKIHGVSPSWHG
jgi:hypothetical protein